jgi:uncharacterized protein YbjT (DUF2867 family)
MSEQKQLIAVFGATGSQGGAVVKALLADGTFQIRALTRNPSSEAAKALLTFGVQVVAADLDDVASCTAALKDCYGAFVVTNYWADMNVEHEMQQTENASVACKSAGVQHVVLSTLEDSRTFIKEEHAFSKLDSGKYYVPHLDGKGEAAIKFQAAVPTTLLYTSFYYSNFIAFGMGPKKGESGEYAITLPLGDKKLMMNAVEDIGKMAAFAFKDATCINTSLYVASTAMTVLEIAAAFEKIMGVKVAYNAVTPAQYAGFGFPGADDLANMFKFFADFDDHFFKTRDPAIVEKKIKVLPFTTWLQDHKADFAA